MEQYRKIIITFSYYGIGGAQRRAINLANEFIKKGYKVTVLAVLGEDGSIEPNENYFGIDKSIELISIPDHFENEKNDPICMTYIRKVENNIRWLKRIQYVVKSVKRINNVLNNSIRGIRNSLDLRYFLVNNQGAIIISFGFNIFEKVYWASRNLDFKLVYAETNASNKFLNDKNFNATVALLKKADAWVFQTQEQMAFLGYGDNPRAKVIYNPISDNLPDVNFNNREKVIVNFCRLSPQKNLMLLLEAFKLFSQSYPEYVLKIYADIVNENNILLKKELVEYIKYNGLKDKAFILPPTDDIHNVINKCSMFVSSSNYEGISNSMIEAMAMGLPCVCTDCLGGGASEMIKDGVNGLLVPVKDEYAMKNAMCRMISEVGLADRCSHNAMKVRVDLDIKKIAVQWLSIIDSI